eukprot:621865-Rhodomonas_salina.1
MGPFVGSMAVMLGASYVQTSVKVDVWKLMDATAPCAIPTPAGYWQRTLVWLIHTVNSHDDPPIRACTE